MRCMSRFIITNSFYIDLICFFNAHLLPNVVSSLKYDI